jgi:Rieske Fe-S protein
VKDIAALHKFSLGVGILQRHSPVVLSAWSIILSPNTHTIGSSSPVGEPSEFSSLIEPVMRTIQIGQVDGWRKTVSEEIVYVTKDSQGQLRVLTSICPHLGCTVPWNKEKNQFVCPCPATAQLLPRMELA